MMRLQILLPTRVFADINSVSRMVLRTIAGSLGVLPQRLDCVAGLVPGILCYEAEHGVMYVAVDRGVMVKSGSDVRVSVRRAISGNDLSRLHDAVRSQFEAFTHHDQEARQSTAKLEAGLIASMQALRHE